MVSSRYCALFVPWLTRLYCIQDLENRPPWGTTDERGARKEASNMELDARALHQLDPERAAALGIKVHPLRRLFTVCPLPMLVVLRQMQILLKLPPASFIV